MDASNAELPQPTKDQTAASNATRSPELQRQHEQTSSLGRAILDITQDREANRWTPFTRIQQFPPEDIAVTKRKRTGEVVEEEDVSEANRGSLAIALEAATQVNEFRSTAAGIREDSDSLQHLITAIRNGGALNQDLIKQNPSLIAAEMKKIIARRQKIVPDQVKFTEEQLMRIADEQFRNAFGRLSKSAQALSGYLGR